MRQLIDRLLRRRGVTQAEPTQVAVERTGEAEVNREQTRELVSKKVELAFLGFEERFTRASGIHGRLAATIWQTPFAELPNLRASLPDNQRRGIFNDGSFQWDEFERTTNRRVEYMVQRTEKTGEPKAMKISMYITTGDGTMNDPKKSVTLHVYLDEQRPGDYSRCQLERSEYKSGERAFVDEYLDTLQLSAFGESGDVLKVEARYAKSPWADLGYKAASNRGDVTATNGILSMSALHRKRSWKVGGEPDDHWRSLPITRPDQIQWDPKFARAPFPTATVEGNTLSVCAPKGSTNDPTADYKPVTFQLDANVIRLMEDIAPGLFQIEKISQLA